MNAKTVEEIASKLKGIAEQMEKSARVLDTDDANVLADVGAVEGARLKSAIEELDELLPQLSEVLGYALDEKMGPVVATSKLTKAAKQIARHDASKLQILGRALFKHEEARVQKALGSIVHLDEALEILEGSDA